MTDACLNKSTIGKDRYVCGVAFKDHTWCEYSMNATTDIEAQGLLRKYFDERIKNSNGLNEDSATVEFIKVLRVEEIEEADDDDWRSMQYGRRLWEERRMVDAARADGLPPAQRCQESGEP